MELLQALRHLSLRLGLAISLTLLACIKPLCKVPVVIGGQGEVKEMKLLQCLAMLRIKSKESVCPVEMI